MTTIISRLYPDQTRAANVAKSAADIGAQHTEVVTSGDMAADRMKALDIAPEAAALYAPHIEAGAALVAIRAEFAPIGLAAACIEMADGADPMDVGVDDENRYMRIKPKTEVFSKASVLSSHRQFLNYPEGGRKRGRVFDVFGLASIIRNRVARSTLQGSPHISTVFLPIPLLDVQRKRVSATAGPTLTSPVFRTLSRS